jgi:hypothetical protein
MVCEGPRALIPRTTQYVDVLRDGDGAVLRIRARRLEGLDRDAVPIVAFIEEGELNGRHAGSTADTHT